MNWLRALNEARTAGHVLDVVNEYLADQTDEFWSLIPESTRPPGVSETGDVHDWHDRLTDEIVKAKSPPNLKLQDLCVFFLRASVRLHQIALKDSDPSGSSNDTSFSASASPKRRA